MEERLYLEQDADANCEHLAGLYADRGDYATAQAYLERIDDETRMADTARILAHDEAYIQWLHRKSTSAN